MCTATYVYAHHTDSPSGDYSEVVYRHVSVGSLLIAKSYSKFLASYVLLHVRAVRSYTVTSS